MKKTAFCVNAVICDVRSGYLFGEKITKLFVISLEDIPNNDRYI